MIKYIEGDVLAAPIARTTVLMHVCNNQYVMGAGIALQIAKKWPRVYEMYKLHKTLELGTCQWVTADKDLVVVNMIAQTLEWVDNKPPLSYEALQNCLSEIAEVARHDDLVVRAPKIGSYLAGGEWKIIEKMIETTFTDIEVEIYVLPATNDVVKNNLLKKFSKSINQESK